MTWRAYSITKTLSNERRLKPLLTAYQVKFTILHFSHNMNTAAISREK